MNHYDYAQQTIYDHVFYSHLFTQMQYNRQIFETVKIDNAGIKTALSDKASEMNKHTK